MEDEFELAGTIAFARIAHGLPGAAVPEHDGAAAVFSLRYDAFEAALLDGMILDVHRQSLHARVEAWPLGDRPAFQDTVKLQPKVVMQMARSMFLNDIRPTAPRGSSPLGFGSSLEMSLAFVFGE